MTALGHHLTYLETSGLIRLAQMEPELEYMFRHALVQDAAYESMLIADRQRLHHRVGEILEQLYPDRLEELASILAHHFALAENDTRALKYYTLAGDVAARSHAAAEAIEYYTHALAITRRNPDVLNSSQLADLYTKLGRTYEIDGNYDRALGVYAELESLAQDCDDQRLMLAALMTRATVHAAPTKKLNTPLAEALCQQALPIAHDLQDYEAESKIHWNLMLVHSANTPAKAIEHGEASLAIAREHNLHEREAYALHDLSWLYQTQGQVSRRLTMIQAAASLWRELDNKPMLADALNSIASRLFLSGQYAQSIACAEEVLEFSQKINNLWNQSYSQLTLGPLYLEIGHTSQAIDTMKSCIRLGNQAGFGMPSVEAASQLSYTYGILLGDLAQGLEWANYVLARAEANYRQWADQTRALLIWLHITHGNLDKAAEIQRQYKLTDDLETYRPLILLVNIALTLNWQAYDQAIMFADRAAGMMNKWGARPFLSDILYYKGQALLALDKPDEAHRILNEARTKAEDIGSKRSLWFILAALAQLEDRRGNLAEAANLYQQAHAVIDYIAAHIYQPDLRAGFLSRPDVRAVMEATTP